MLMNLFISQCFVASAVIVQTQFLPWDFSQPGSHKHKLPNSAGPCSDLANLPIQIPLYSNMLDMPPSNKKFTFSGGSDIPEAAGSLH